MDIGSPEIQHYIDFFLARQNLVVGMAGSYAPRPDLTHDIVQEVFLQFVRYACEKQLNLETDARPVLCQITKNVALAYWRRYRRENGKAIGMIGERLRTAQRQAAVLETEEEYQAGRIGALRLCIDKLPVHHRKLLDEHYKQGVPMNEIARNEKITPLAVRQRFSRLRALLKECIRKTLHEQD